MRDRSAPPAPADEFAAQQNPHAAQPRLACSSGRAPGARRCAGHPSACLACGGDNARKALAIWSSGGSWGAGALGTAAAARRHVAQAHGFSFEWHTVCTFAVIGTVYRPCSADSQQDEQEGCSAGRWPARLPCRRRSRGSPPTHPPLLHSCASHPPWQPLATASRHAAKFTNPEAARGRSRMAAPCRPREGQCWHKGRGAVQC